MATTYKVYKLTGTSLDKKPTGGDVATGSTFLETNTGKTYTYNRTTNKWTLTSSSSTGSTANASNTAVGILSIKLTSSEGLVDTYTITFTNGAKTYFTVTNGKDGSNADIIELNKRLGKEPLNTDKLYTLDLIGDDKPKYQLYKVLRLDGKLNKFNESVYIENIPADKFWPRTDEGKFILSVKDIKLELVFIYVGKNRSDHETWQALALDENNEFIRYVGRLYPIKDSKGTLVSYSFKATKQTISFKSLQDELKDTSKYYEEVNKHLNEFESYINGKVKALDTEMDTFEQVITKRVDETDQRVKKVDVDTQKFFTKVTKDLADAKAADEQFKTEINSTITNFKADINSKITSIEQSTSASIEAMEADITAFKDDITISFDTLETTTTTAISELTEELRDTSDVLDTKIEETKATLDTKIEETKATLDTKIEETKDALDLKITTVDTRVTTINQALNNRCDENENEINALIAKTATLDSKIDSEISRLDTKLSQEMVAKDNALDTKLTTQINTTKTELDAALKETQGRIKEYIDTEHKNLMKTFTGMITNMQKTFDEKIAEVDDKLAKHTEAMEKLHEEIEERIHDVETSVEKHEKVLYESPNHGLVSRVETLEESIYHPVPAEDQENIILNPDGTTESLTNENCYAITVDEETGAETKEEIEITFVDVAISSDEDNDTIITP